MTFEDKSIEKPIYVTQPFLPPLEELIPYLQEIWESKILTNGGPLHQRLEHALCEYLGVPYISLFNNGTIALITALQALDLKGEVVTTPYSFIATTNAILWNNLKPVFVDIDPDTFNLDPNLIEAAITPRTSAILPVHCYGTPCEVDTIDAIAKKHQLKVVYDAAHAFGVRCHCGSILNHGDLSVISFHATKVFNTFEGGAIVCKSAEMKKRIDRLKNFGFSSETELIAPGLNGKMSEINAAVGLAQLKHVDASISLRRQIDVQYRKLLHSIDGIRCPPREYAHNPNYSYFPILVGEKYPLTRDQLNIALQEKNIIARRYFFPPINKIACGSEMNERFDENLQRSEEISNQVLCLPIYPGLHTELVDRITNNIREIAYGLPYN